MQVRNALWRQAGQERVQVGGGPGFLLAIAFAIAQDQLVTRARHSNVEQASFAALMGCFAFAFGWKHTGGGRHRIGMRLQGEIALDQSGQVDHGELQSLAGMDGHGTDDIRFLRAGFCDSLLPAVTSILTQA